MSYITLRINIIQHILHYVYYIPSKLRVYNRKIFVMLQFICYITN